jgi:hypothetical protein
VVAVHQRMPAVLTPTATRYAAQETMDSVLRICGMLAAVLAVLVPISIYLDPGGPDPSRV